MINTLDQILKKQDPNMIALIDQDTQLTYGELDELSDHLAEVLLLQYHIKAHDKIAVCIPKSWQAVLAMLAILKARASYVILDAKAPEMYQQKILELAQVKLILKELPKLEPTSRLCNFAFPEIHESDECYIYFTSGSTGSPKGACFNHQRAMNFVKWATKYFNFSAQEKIACVSEFTFDVCLFDIFVTFNSGATLVLVPDPIKLFSKNLINYLNKFEVTTLQLVPSLWDQLQGNSFPHLKKIIFTGQALRKKQFDSLRNYSNLSFYNLYGQTEANSYLCYKFNGGDDQDYPVAISQMPLPNYLSIKEQHLWIHQHSLMLNYLGHDLVEDFDTHDVVEIRNNKLYLIGRSDNMIKLKGYRFYPEMVERVLHQKVQASCVFFDEAQSSLIAVIESPDEKLYEKLDESQYKNLEEDLRNFCKNHLLAHQLPQKYFFVKEILKNANGKLDRKLLKSKFCSPQNG